MSIERVNEGLDTNYSQAFNDLAIANEERPVGSENRVEENNPYFTRTWQLKEQTADKLAQKAIEKAKQLGIAITVSIVDASGKLQKLSKMDNARSVSVDVSQSKAVTAATVRVATRVLMENNGKTPGHPYNNFPNAVLLAGGLPIFTTQGDIVGAIGISGGSGDQDEACAQAALNAI